MAGNGADAFEICLTLDVLNMYSNRHQLLFESEESEHSQPSYEMMLLETEDH